MSAHGTYSRYGRSGCRCATCTTRQRERVARNRAERLVVLLSTPVGHGSRSSYDAGCRCDRCKAARSAAYRRLERVTS